MDELGVLAAFTAQLFGLATGDTDDLVAHALTVSIRERPILVSLATEDPYGVLGVATDATTDQIRRAYHRRARDLHPDHRQDLVGGAAAAAERSMQDVNEAWRVLGDPTRKASFDRQQRGEPAQTALAEEDEWAPPDFDDEAPVVGPVAASALRGIPWLLVIGILVVIFVFTAYAAGTSRQSDPDVETPGAVPTIEVDDCVRLLGRNGLEITACDGSTDAVVVAKLSVGRPCPRGSSAVYLPDERVNVCLR